MGAGADINIDDLRERARRRLPRAVFDYIDGGAEDELTLRRNREGFERITFRPRVLVDASARDQTRMRQSLAELRTEIEAFLEELGMASHPPAT